MRGRLLLYTVIFVIFFSYVASRTVLAHPYKKEVLGESVKASDVTVPPVSAGPGLILPDSPLYFLDKVVQSIRLALAFNPEQKAQVHEFVANERLAELRVMMAKNNTHGITLALTELAKENNLAASELKLASSKGKNVKEQALRLNEAMKVQRDFLNAIIDQSKGSLKLQLKAAKEELKTAKVEVEDELPEDALLKEVEENIQDAIEEDITDASESAKNLAHSIDVLTKLASDAAKKNQEKREEALLRAIENKNEALKRRQERVLRLEKKRQEKLLQMRKDAAQSALETIKNAQETAEKFDEMKKAEEDMMFESSDEMTSPPDTR